MQTDIHKLLYFLAKRMLEQEKHVISVDELFDDDIIGDFVKSIQIDSPYQQLLLEGVLTESVRNEKLYVSFTVEGYFHFVLGEVIFDHTYGKEPNALKKIVEENKLNGVKEGVEQCLIRDVQNDNLNRLIWLIDHGFLHIDVCIIPLSSAFLMANAFLKNGQNENAQYIKTITNLLNILLVYKSEYDISVLKKTLNQLKKIQQHNLVSDIYKNISELITPDNIINASLYVKTIEHIPKELRIQKLDYLLQLFKPDSKGKELSKVYSDISEQYRLNGNYDNALEYIEKSWQILALNKSRSGTLKIEYFNSLGKIYQGKKIYNKAIEYFQKARLISVKKYGEQSDSVAISNSNIGLAYLLDKQYDLGIEYIEKSINILSKIFGNQHINISRIYMMYATGLIAKKEYKKVIEIYHKSIQIELKIYGSKSKYVAFLYQAIGKVWEILNVNNIAIDYFNQSLEIYYKTNKDSSAEIAEVHSLIGSIYLDKVKEFDTAIQHFEKALEINLIINGKLHQSVFNSLNNLGLAWKRKYNYQKAIDYFQDSASIIIYLNENIDKYLIPCYQNITLCFNKIKDYKKAIEYYGKALFIVRDYYKKENKIEADIYNYMGLNFELIGDYDTALDNIEKSLAIRIALSGHIDKGVANCYNNLASINYKNKIFNKALELFRISLDIKLKIYDEGHIEISNAYVKIAKTFTKMHNHTQALDYYILANGIQPTDDLLYHIAYSYEQLQQFDSALIYFIEAAEITKSRLTLQNDLTKKYFKKCYEIATALNKVDSLPKWIKELDYDL